MAWLVTPAQLTRRADLFHQLGQMTAAGLGLIQAVEVLARNPPERSLRGPLSAATALMQQGSSVTDAFAVSGHWLSSFDVSLIQAGEQSGRLPQCFQLLAKYYEDRAQLFRQVIGFTLYPLFIFHIAVLLFPVGRFTALILQGEVLAYVEQKLAILAPLYGGALLLYYLMQSKRGEKWRAIVERVLSMVPILGTARRSLAMARLSVALEALLAAGVTIIEGWELAAAASGSPALRRFVARARPDWLNGVQPGESISASPVFPSAFSSLYKTGEVSGQLDDALRRAHAYYQDEGSRKMKAFVFGAAGVLVGLVFLMAAIQIVMFWMGYFQQINNAINFNQ